MCVDVIIHFTDMWVVWGGATEKAGQKGAVRFVGRLLAPPPTAGEENRKKGEEGKGPEESEEGDREEREERQEGGGDRER